LLRYKVELDAVLTEVGSERLFRHFMDLLKKAYPKRDYTRVISAKPSLEHHYHKSIRNFKQYISNHADSVVKKESEKIESELKDIKGFIEVEEKEKEIDKRLGDIIEADEHLKDIASAIEDLASQEGYDLEKLDSQERNHGENDERVS
jgi:hypothetical protein